MKKISKLVILVFVSVMNQQMMHADSFRINSWTCGNSINGLVPDTDGFWAVTSGGLVRWNLGTGEYVKYTTSQGLNDNWFQSGTRDLSGKFWFGSLYGGIMSYDGQNWGLITEDQGIPYNEIVATDVDPDNRVWFSFGAAFGNGIGIKEGIDWIFITKTHGLNHGYINAIQTDNDGAWVGSRRGINRIENDSVISGYSIDDGLVSDMVYALTKDHEGSLWIGTDEGISLFNGTVFKNYTMADGLPSDKVLSLVTDSNGTVWAGTDSGLAYFDGEKFQCLDTGASGNSAEVRALLPLPDGALLVGMYGQGVEIIKNFHVINQLMTDDFLPDNHIRCMALEGQRKWYGCDSGQVGWFDGEMSEVFNPQQDLVPAGVRAMAIDHTGNKWFGTFGNGIFKYDGNEWTRITEEDGLVNNLIMGLFVDDDNSIWISTFGGGICRYDGSTWTVFNRAMGLDSDLAYRVAKEPTGVYWFCLDSGVTRYDGETLTHYTEDDGLIFHRVYEVEVDQDNVKWFGACAGLSRFDDTEFTNFHYEDGLSHYRIRDVLFDERGLLWMATGRGLTIYNGQNFSTIMPADGMAGHETYIILDDHSGNFWTCAEGGITRITPDFHGNENKPPCILAAGWRYIPDAKFGCILWEAIPFDKDGDPMFVEIGYQGQPLGIPLNDSGVKGDKIPDDGIFSYELTLDDYLTPGMYSLSLIVSDIYANSGYWPELVVK